MSLGIVKDDATFKNYMGSLQNKLSEAENEYSKIEKRINLATHTSTNLVSLPDFEEFPFEELFCNLADDFIAVLGQLRTHRIDVDNSSDIDSIYASLLKLKGNYTEIKEIELKYMESLLHKCNVLTSSDNNSEMHPLYKDVDSVQNYGSLDDNFAQPNQFAMQLREYIGCIEESIHNIDSKFQEIRIGPGCADGEELQNTESSHLVEINQNDDETEPTRPWYKPNKTVVAKILFAAYVGSKILMLLFILIAGYLAGK